MADSTTLRDCTARPAHDGGVAVAGEGDGCTLGPQASSIFADGTDQLAALLPPDTAAAREYPCRPSRPDEGRPIAISVVGAGSTHDGGVAVRGQRNGHALVGASHRAGSDQLRQLLERPCRRVAGKNRLATLGTARKSC